MYNDENNLYNYTYRKDGSENRTGTSVDEQLNRAQAPVQQVPIMEHPPQKNRLGIKIAALALSCALLGGATGAGVAWGVTNMGGNETSVNVSARPASAVAVKSVDGKNAMTDAEVYAANVNSVVSINTSATTNYFGQTVQTASSGSGFILTADGYIVTNHHVVADATNVEVTLYNGEEYPAVYIGGDEDYDIAVLKIEVAGLQNVTLGDSSSLNVGDHVLAVGNPLGELTFSMSGGMVSSVNRAINVDGTPFNMIQTDASINPGNSGGPLFNQFGEVIGIVSAKYSQYSDTTVEGLGFAIPMNDVLAMIQDIMTNGYVTNKPYLGITAMTMNEQLAAQFRYDITTGVFVSAVEENGAAAKAGMQMGDMITKVDEKAIASMDDLNAAKKSDSAGDTATFTIYRNGATQTMEVTWGSVPEEQQQTVQPQQPQEDNTENNNITGDMNDLFEYFFNSQYGG